MAKNHIQEGDVLEWTNDTGGDIASGDVVKAGLFIGIALGDIADTEEGRVGLAEVWEMPKATPLVLAQGARVYWDVADGELNATDTDNFDAGLVFRAALSADTTVQVLLGA